MTKYSKEFIDRHVKRYRDLITSDYYTLPGEYAKEMNIPASTFCRWLKWAGVRPEHWMNRHGKVTS